MADPSRRLVRRRPRDTDEEDDDDDADYDATKDAAMETEDDANDDPDYAMDDGEKGSKSSSKAIATRQQQLRDQEDQEDSNNTTRRPKKRSRRGDAQQAAEASPTSPRIPRGVPGASSSGSGSGSGSGEAGTLLSLRLDNFMCHTCLSIPFHPGVNIITGRNGSGKSAILTGLQIGLGLKTLSTNRGSKLSDLVRNSSSNAATAGTSNQAPTSNTARVQIVVNNRGDEALNPARYGSHFIIERTIHHTASSASGTSTYKIINGDTKAVVSTNGNVLKKEILDYLNIQLDNPCIIMTQDTARRFLTMESPTDKYSFFLKATQLHSMLNDLDETAKLKKTLQLKLATKSSALKNMEQDLFVIRNELKVATNLEALQEELVRLGRYYAWSIIKEMDHEVDIQREQQSREEDMIKTRQQKIAQEQEELKNGPEAQRQALVEQLEQQSDIITQRSNEIIKIDHEITEFQNQLNTFKAGIADSTKRKKILERNIAQVHARIQTIREDRIKALKQRTDREDGVTKKLLEIEELKQRETQIRENIQQLAASLPALENQQRALGERRAAFEKQHLDIVNDIQILERRKIDQERSLSDIRERKKNLFESRPRLFGGDRISDVWREILKSQSKFSRIPIGPLGYFIKSADNPFAFLQSGRSDPLDYSTALERLLYFTSQSYVVANHHDEKVLYDIFNAVFSRSHSPTVIIYPNFDGQAYDITNVLSYARRVIGAQRSNQVCTVEDAVQIFIPSRDSQQSGASSSSHHRANPIDEYNRIIGEKYGEARLNLIIRNLLRDNHSIESVLLVPDVRIAKSIIYHQADFRPKNQTSSYVPNLEAYTAEGTNVFVRKGTEVLRGNQYPPKGFFINEKNNAGMESIEQKVNRGLEQIQQQLTEKRRQLDEHNQSPDSNLAQEIAAAKRSFTNTTYQVNRAKSDLEKTSRAISNKNDEVETETEQSKPPPEEDENFLLESIRNHEKDIQEYDTKIAELTQKRKELEESELVDRRKLKAKIAEEIRQLQYQSEDQQKRIAVLLEEISKKTARIRTAETHLTALQNKFESTKKKTRELEARREETFATFLTNFPNGVPPEDEEIKPPAEYDQQRKDLKIQIATIQKQIGGRSAENIRRDCLKLEASYEKTKLEIEKGEQNFENVKTGLEKRYQRWITIRNQFGSLITWKFNAYLSQKGHSGTVNFAHEKESLQIQVHLEGQMSTGASSASTAPQTAKSSTSDLKELSGGERSFSTVAFLLALWEIVEAPFRSLDEFDVFMDAQYRKLALDLLLTVTRKKANKRQLILITPHELADVTPGPDVHIVRLKPPVRGNQTTLDEYLDGGDDGNAN